MQNEIKRDQLNFILGGNATFAIVQDSKEGNSGGLVWYNISSKDGKIFFVSGLGAGNRKLYQGYFFGKDARTGSITELHLKSGGKGAEGDVDCKPLVWLLRRLGKREPLPDIVHIISNGTCSCCGRKLTDLESIDRGIGPDCYKKLKELIEFCNKHL
jgi:hypothetical protein